MCSTQLLPVGHSASTGHSWVSSRVGGMAGRLPPAAYRSLYRLPHPPIHHRTVVASPSPTTQRKHTHQAMLPQPHLSLRPKLSVRFSVLTLLTSPRPCSGESGLPLLSMHLEPFAMRTDSKRRLSADPSAIHAPTLMGYWRGPSPPLRPTHDCRGLTDESSRCHAPAGPVEQRDDSATTGLTKERSGACRRSPPVYLPAEVRDAVAAYATSMASIC